VLAAPAPSAVDPVAAPAVVSPLPAFVPPPVLAGEGTTGYLSLIGFELAPPLPESTTSVPAPVLAPEDAAAAASAGAPAPTPVASPLASLLPVPPDGGAPPPELPVLASPTDMTSGTSAGTLADFAPAALVLSATLSGLFLSARRRRTS
jgi:hypothetical protein